MDFNEGYFHYIEKQKTFFHACAVTIPFNNLIGNIIGFLFKF